MGKLRILFSCILLMLITIPTNAKQQSDVNKAVVDRLCAGEKDQFLCLSTKIHSLNETISQLKTTIEKKPATTTLKGAICTPPKFSFAWLDYQTPVLIAKANPAGWYKLTLWPLKGTQHGPYPEKGLALPTVSTKSASYLTVEGTQIEIDRAEIEGLYEDKDLFNHAYIKIEYDANFDAAGNPLLPTANNATCNTASGISQPIALLQKHTLRLDFGRSFVLQKAGGFKSSNELAIAAHSRWNGWLNTATEFRVISLGKTSDDRTAENTSDTPDTSTDGTAPESNQPPIDNPFIEGGTSLLGRAYFSVHHPEIEWIQLFSAIGFTTTPETSVAFVDARQHWMTGVLFRVPGYNQSEPTDSFANTLGFFLLGYGRDKLWRYDILVDTDNDPDTADEAVTQKQYERWFIGMQLEMPQLGSRTFRFRIRASANIPVSGEGPSDVRAGVFISADLKSLGSIFNLDIP